MTDSIFSQEEIDTIKEAYPVLTVKEMIKEELVTGKTEEQIRSKINLLLTQKKLVPKIKRVPKNNSCGKKQLEQYFIEGKPVCTVRKETGYSNGYLQQIKKDTVGVKATPSEISIENDEKLLNYLKENKWASYSEIRKNFSDQSLLRLVNNRIIFYIEFNHRKCKGSSLDYRYTPMFKTEYYGKRFACYTRTDMIRLASKALIVSDDKRVKHGVSHFISQNFSKAECLALRNMLGIKDKERKYNKVIFLNKVKETPIIETST